MAMIGDVRETVEANGPILGDLYLVIERMTIRNMAGELLVRVLLLTGYDEGSYHMWSADTVEGDRLVAPGPSKAR